MRHYLNLVENAQNDEHLETASKNLKALLDGGMTLEEIIARLKERGFDARPATPEDVNQTSDLHEGAWQVVKKAIWGFINGAVVWSAGVAMVMFWLMPGALPAHIGLGLVVVGSSLKSLGAAFAAMREERTPRTLAESADASQAKQFVALVAECRELGASPKLIYDRLVENGVDVRVAEPEEIVNAQSLGEGFGINPWHFSVKGVLAWLSIGAGTLLLSLAVNAFAAPVGTMIAGLVVACGMLGLAIGVMEALAKELRASRRP